MIDPVETMNAEPQRLPWLGPRAVGFAVWAAAIGGPLVVTAGLFYLTSQAQRDYIFFYLGLVAVIGVFGGIWPALACAVVSFLCVDYFFAPPVYTWTVAD